MTVKKCNGCLVINVETDRQFCASCLATKTDVLEKLENPDLYALEEDPDPYYSIYRKKDFLNEFLSDVDEDDGDDYNSED